jgi:hypothetical protein
MMTAETAKAFCPAWAAIPGQSEPVRWYNQANNMPVTNIGSNTPIER